VRGRFIAMFVTALVACFASAPANEYRGYVLHVIGCKKQGKTPLSFSEFFDFQKSLVSGGGGPALSCSLSLSALS